MSESSPSATTYPTGTIAKLLMLTDRHVQRLTAEGVIPKTGTGRYELAPAVQGYIRYLRERALRGDTAGEEVAKSKGRLLKARARAAEIEADTLEANSVTRSEVDKAWGQIIDIIRTRVLAVPSACAGPAFSAASLVEVNAIITAAVYDALDDASRSPVYDAPRGAAEGSEPDAAGAAEAEAAAEADRIGMG